MSQELVPLSKPSTALAPEEERLWVLACHLSPFAGYVIPFGNVIAPLMVWMFKREASEAVNAHGKESINFQISLTIYISVLATLFGAGIVIPIFGWAVALVTLPLLVGVAMWGLVVQVVAAIKANDGQPYSYPLTLRFLS